MTSRNTTVAAVLASAAVAGIAAGVLLHGMGGAGATPVAGTAGSTGAATRATQPVTSRPSAIPTTTAPGATTRGGITHTPAASAASAASATSPTSRGPLSEKSLMVANDYVAAGWPTAQLHTAPGAGQAAITACQTSNPEQQYGLRKMYSGQAQSGDLYADQWVLDFKEPADAQQMLSDVLDWRTRCTDPSNQGMKGVGFTASAAVQVTLPDGSEGQRWTMDFDQDNHLLRQLVAVVRTGTRVSVSVVSTSPQAARAVDAETLAERSAARLG